MNTAENEGGALIYLNQAPQESANSPNVYSQNQATYGSNSIANYARNLVLEPISNHDPYLETDLLRQQALTFEKFEVVSGIALSFYFNITDINGVNYADENLATAKFRVNS